MYGVPLWELLEVKQDLETLQKNFANFSTTF